MHSKSRLGEFSYEHVTGFKYDHLPKDQPSEAIDQKIIEVMKYKKKHQIMIAKYNIKMWYSEKKKLREAEEAARADGDDPESVGSHTPHIKAIKDQIKELEDLILEMKTWDPLTSED